MVGFFYLERGPLTTNMEEHAEVRARTSTRVRFPGTPKLRGIILTVRVLGPYPSASPWGMSVGDHGRPCIPQLVPAKKKKKERND